MDPQAQLDYLLSPQAVRERTLKIFALAESGKTHFELHLDKLDAAADYVFQVILGNYPDLKIPFHSRWGHFRAGGIDRVSKISGYLDTLSVDERAASLFDLAIVSVLLDAGAGDKWCYRESSSGRTLARSEGLAVASLDMFKVGLFSSNPRKPLQVDAAGLLKLTKQSLASGFNASDDNPLLALDGRLDLLHALGSTIKSSSYFSGAVARPGNLAHYFLTQSRSQGGQMRASQVLIGVLQGMGGIWPGRALFHGKNLGDTWMHSALGASGSFESFVPFHKLSQWLSYSLMEPLIDAGVKITALDEMTGLPEYRNGGLFLDLGVIKLRDPKNLHTSHTVDSELVIEWRALTVVLLDRLATVLRKKLSQTPEQLPLVKILEGGTWHAGRKIAATLRPGGAPPLKLTMDGTVF